MWLSLWLSVSLEIEGYGVSDPRWLPRILGLASTLLPKPTFWWVLIMKPSMEFIGTLQNGSFS